MMNSIIKKGVHMPTITYSQCKTISGSDTQECPDCGNNPKEDSSKPKKKGCLGCFITLLVVVTISILGNFLIGKGRLETVNGTY